MSSLLNKINALLSGPKKPGVGKKQCMNNGENPLSHWKIFAENVCLRH
jgi:hypothetical protein